MPHDRELPAGPVTEVIVAAFGFLGAAVSSYAALKAKQAEHHTRPNGTGERIPDVVERIDGKVDELQIQFSAHKQLHEDQDLDGRVSDLEVNERWRA